MTGRDYAEPTTELEQQPATATARSDPAGPAASVLALQDSAGNQAVARMMAAQQGSADGQGAPVLDQRAIAVTMDQQLQAERAKLLAEYQPTTRRWQILKDDQVSGHMTPEMTTEFADLEKEQKRIGGLLDQNDKDTRLLSDPSASEQSFNDMMARRNQQVDFGTSTDSTATGWRIGPTGLTSANTTTSTRMDAGTASTMTNSSATTIDTTGVANRKTDTLTMKQGENSSTLTSTTDKKFDAAAGNYSWGSSDKAEYKTPDSSTSELRGTSSSVGLGGGSVTNEKTTVTDGTVDSTKTTGSISRGDGKLGAGGNYTKKTGTQDDKGVLTKGNESSAGGSGGLIAGPDGTGAFGSVNGGTTQTLKEGVKVGATAGFDGKVLTNVLQVPGSDPAQYEITVSFNLSGKIGGSGSAEKTQDASGAKGSVGGTISGSAALSGQFVHVFNDAEAKQYLAAVNAKGASTGPKELQVVSLIAEGKISGAMALLNDVSAGWSSPMAALATKEGDSAQFTVDAKGEIGATTGGDMAGFGVKGNISGNDGHTVTRSIAHKGGKIVITVSIADTSGYNAGGGASMEAAGGGFQHSASDSASQSMTFTLDPQDKAFADQYNLISGAVLLSQLQAIKQDHANLVTASTISDGTASSNTTSATVGPLGLEIGDQSSLDHTVSTDASGTTETFTGSKGGSAALTGPGGVKVQHTEKDTVSGTVGPDGQASGDVNTATSDTSLGASWDALKKAWSDDKFGLVTGGAKVTQEQTDVLGMKLSDGDFETIAAMAENIDMWKKVEQGSEYTAWIQTGHAIAAAHHDRKAIAKILADYGHEHDGAAHAIERIVRGAGEATGGTMYEWPGDLSAEKTQYAALIGNDQVAAIRAQEEAGNRAAALESATGVLAKIDALTAAMQSKQDKFANAAALGEMLAAAAAQRGTVAREISLLKHRLDGIPVGMVETAASQSHPDAEVDQSAAKAELAGYTGALAVLEQKQQQVFEFVQKQQVIQDTVWTLSSADTEGVQKAFNSLRDDIYPQWEEVLKKARAAASRAGLDPWSIQPTPGKGFYNDLYKKFYNAKDNVYEWPPKQRDEYGNVVR